MWHDGNGMNEKGKGYIENMLPFRNHNNMRYKARTETQGQHLIRQAKVGSIL